MEKRTTNPTRLGENKKAPRDGSFCSSGVRTKHRWRNLRWQWRMSWQPARNCSRPSFLVRLGINGLLVTSWTDVQFTCPTNKDSCHRKVGSRKIFKAPLDLIWSSEIDVLPPWECRPSNANCLPRYQPSGPQTRRTCRSLTSAERAGDWLLGITLMSHESIGYVVWGGNGLDNDLEST